MSDEQLKEIEFKYCGCRLPSLKKMDGTTSIYWEPDVEEMPLTCPRTWDLISEGNTKGIFQLESYLGQQMARKMQPRNIDQMAALISLMRPGCMQAMFEGKSLTQHYIDRKNGSEPVSYLHPAMEPILHNTFGVLTFQEQAMQLAQYLAGFNLQEADILRVAMGKKKADVMAQVKDKFIDGAKLVGMVTPEQAAEIFSWIEASQRYSFNKSHAVAYAMNGYMSAYLKAHWPTVMFTSYLQWSTNKAESLKETYQLVNNARIMDVQVMLPSLVRMNVDCALERGIVYFGLANIKGVGEGSIKKVITKLNKIDWWVDFTWPEFLLWCSPHVPSNILQALISVGALDYLGEPRTKMLHEYSQFKQLTDIQVNKLVASVPNPIDKTVANPKRVTKTSEIFQAILDTVKIDKRQTVKIHGLLGSIEHPPYPLVDSAEWKAGVERTYLGIAISASRVQSHSSDKANCTCREFLTNGEGYCMIAAEIDEVKEHTIANGKSTGQTMAFLGISDGTCALESVIAFSEAYKKYQNLLVEGNTVIIGGFKDDRGTLVVKNVLQI